MKKEQLIKALKIIPTFSARLVKKTGMSNAYVSFVKDGKRKMPESWLPFGDEIIKEMRAELDRVSRKR